MSVENKKRSRKKVIERDMAEIVEVIEAFDANSLMSEDAILLVKSALEDVLSEFEQELEEIDFDLERWEVVGGDEG